MDEIKKSEGMVLIPIQEYRDLIERSVKAEMNLEIQHAQAEEQINNYRTKYWAIKDNYEKLLARIGKEDGEDDGR